MTTLKQKEDQFVKVQIEWYCAKCWQEGISEIEVPRKDRKKVFDPAEVPEIRREHAAIIRGFIGKGGKCAGMLRRQEKKVKPRIRREKPPMLPDSGEPIELR